LFALVVYLIAVRTRDMGYFLEILIPPSHTFKDSLHNLRPSTML
jgi:hypothetical protein